jgi:hypothetical protein
MATASLMIAAFIAGYICGRLWGYGIAAPPPSSHLRLIPDKDGKLVVMFDPTMEL